MSITIVTEQFPDGIDVLVNNAGVMFLPDKATKDGYGMTVFDAHVVVLRTSAQQLLETILWHNLSFCGALTYTHQMSKCKRTT